VYGDGGYERLAQEAKGLGETTTWRVGVRMAVA